MKRRILGIFTLSKINFNKVSRGASPKLNILKKKKTHISGLYGAVKKKKFICDIGDTNVRLNQFLNVQLFKLKCF